MNTDRHEKERKAVIERYVRRVLGFKALRQIRVLVNDFENEEARNKRFIKAFGLFIVLLFILVVFIYGSNRTKEVISTGTSQIEEKKHTHIRTDEEIQAIFSKYSEIIYKRYQDSLRINPSLEGEIIFAITVTSDGIVKNIDVESTTIDNPDFINDLIKIIENINFGKSKVPGDDIIFAYPISFTAPASSMNSRNEEI